MARWIDDMDGYLMNRGEEVPTEMSWSLFAKFL